MADEFNVLMKQYPPAVQRLARKTRELVRREMPGAVEQVKMGWKAVWYGPGARMEEQVFAVTAQAKHVNLGFAQGTSLADPDKLLEGTGTNIRHVKIRDEAILSRPAFLVLVRAAVKAGTKKR